MADQRMSEVSFSSDLADEFDRIRVRESYELEEVSRQNTPTPSPLPDVTDQEDEHFLKTQTAKNTQKPRYTMLNYLRKTR